MITLEDAEDEEGVTKQRVEFATKQAWEVFTREMAFEVLSDDFDLLEAHFKDQFLEVARFEDYMDILWLNFQAKDECHG